MAIKLGGFVCDNCRTFRQFEGVMSHDVDEIFFNDTLSNNLLFVKIKDWGFYNTIEKSTTENDWIKWTLKSKCYCPKCDRILKLKKLISKLKSHD